MKKKLLQINSVVNWGSTGRICEEIGQKAISHGWDSYIAYGRNAFSSKSNIIQIGTNRDIYLHGLQTRLFDNHGFASKSSTEKFVREISNIKPDIIHLHNLHGYYLNIDILFNYLSKQNIPIIWTLHDCWPITGHCTYFSYIGCNKWKTHCEKCPQKREYPASFFKDNSYFNYEKKRALFTSIDDITLVPVSKWLSRIINESYLKKYPIKIIHNGIDTDIFKPMDTDSVKQKYNLQNKFVILGVASVWERRKGFMDFKELSKLLDDKMVIVLVGLKPAQIRDLPKNIIGIERTKNINELVTLYALSDVFINPTWEDNFPTTNLESLACGTPVITYNTGGSVESINSKTGFIIEQGDIGEMKNAIDTVHNNGKQEYSEACQNHARKYFNKNERYEKYIELYNDKINA